jgi:WS/DGAT/MGAT family acyltransferase
VVAHYKYERLSAQDNDFLLWEKPSLPMHGGAVQIFERGPLGTEDGGIDFARIKRGYEAILDRIPRYRQKLAWIPGQERAVWVDDAQFNIDYHMRHTALPRPGSERELRNLATRVLERPLDRDRPLWEIWVVEGLDQNRFATISKTHHCMLDGVSGMNLATILMSTDPEYEIQEPRPYLPRPMPSEAELRREDQWRRLRAPLDVLRELQSFADSTDDLAGEIAARARALGQMAWWKAVPSSDTPLNGPVGPHRCVDWMSLRLEDLKAIRKALGCSINDVVLAIITGAVREFMISRQVRPEELDFRASTPVNVRRKEEPEELGNRVSSWIVRLPIGESDPLRQLEAIRAVTEELKESRQAAAVEVVEALHEWVSFDIQSMSKGTQNILVTNIPGPQFPLYMMGAPLLSIYVQPPLLENLGLVVGVMSYNGDVFWGFNADYDRVPDLSDFVGLVRAAYERLAEAAQGA